ncbi:MULTISPECIES: hypothetical protein [Psychrilyobacter]|uniref:LPXTG-motif cell wall anchor domain-containing protein n=1 Tax=Psychrilyobacter piezotolerans TaxID=2293438 RepID=A0ABX9KFT8_9FUSO|nr:MULTISPECIES: hypothetical protein [Psychrilyobacter]MCS5422456.1 hypothetical protein [Psychrilyobacter sp. S5]NDI78354.1 hypothetical protein [Psychrilyobacter piezotolerans]RDE61083.1 hypothetical protein DV867_09580 [Psychrilyobacter sp. S5]REI40724.1 hypothetical protein DYH56_09580 [Psychrilyobacter piezotolerans]
MKKIMLILAVTGVLISCSGKDETVKKETVAEVVAVKDESAVPKEEAAAETAEVVTVEVEKPVLTDEDYESVSEPAKKTVKKTKPAPKPMKKEVVVEEKVAAVETSVDKAVDKVDEVVDKDADKLIAKTETEAKAVEAKTPVEESKSNKTLFGILGAVLVAAAAIFLFKKK